VLKLTDNPPMCTPDVASLADLAGTWWAAYTKARFEKAFAWDLLSRGIGYFLPMREKVGYWGNRKRRLLIPLFTSYVFFCGDPTDRYNALATNRLSHVIDVGNQAALVRELSAVEKALAGGLVIDHYPQLAVGRWARIISGPLMGTEGTVIERKDNKARVVLAITALGQGALIEVDIDVVEAVNGNSGIRETCG